VVCQLWLSENEGAKSWLSVLTDMKNRGLTDIFVAYIDGLAGFADAIRTVYEKAKVQLCIVHLVCAALKIIYMVIHEASKKWTKPIRNWKSALGPFAILFEDCLPNDRS